MEHKIGQEYINVRIDIFIKSNIFPSKSRSFISSCVKSGNFKVNNLTVIKPSTKLALGDVVHYDVKILDIPQDKKDFSFKERDDIEIVFENDQLIVINKPSNLVIHEGVGNSSNTLVDFLVQKYGLCQLSSKRGSHEAGIVHRLDKDTTGLMLIAKTNEAFETLTEQIKNKTCKRKYLALCLGIFTPTHGIIDNHITISKYDRKKFTITNNKDEGKRAITHYKTIKLSTDNKISLIEFSLQTGRTHQIRAQCLHENHQIIGDQKYYSQSNRYLLKLPKEKRERASKIKRQMLHSYYISFQDPQTKKQIIIEKEEPKDMMDAINGLIV